MQVITKIKQAGVEIEEAGMRIASLGERIQAMTEDGVVDDHELCQLQSISNALAGESFGLSTQSDTVESVGHDLKVAVRCINHGWENAIDVHTKRAIVDLAQVRAQREQRQQKAAHISGPDSAA